jgi:hypothetical protein
VFVLHSRWSEPGYIRLKSPRLIMPKRIAAATSLFTTHLNFIILGISSLWDSPFLNLLYRIFTANSTCTQQNIHASLCSLELGSLPFNHPSAIQIAQLLNIIFRDHFRVLSLPLFLLAHTSQDCQRPSQLPLDSESNIRI